MDDNITNAVNFAFDGNAAQMRDSIYAAIQTKVENALDQKKIEIASNLINQNKEE